MKWHNSIITKISFIFALAIIGIIAIFYASMQNNKRHEIASIERFAKIIVHNSFNQKTETLDIKKLNKHGFTLVKNPKIIKILIKNASYDSNRAEMMKNNKNFKSFGIKTIALNKNIYILINHPNKKLIILKSPFKKELLTTFIFPMIAILFVLFLYIAIMRSIFPLYSLRTKIKEFANGNYDINCTSNKKDEIAILSNEFDNSVKKIKNLRDSRQLFLRNIMHEFKTPITKGKLISEMLDDTTYKKTLKKLFRRQEKLLDDFSKIEKLNADELKINTKPYNLEDIIDFSLDILSYDKKHVCSKLLPINLHVDFELFATAIKNLLDNGINYSNDQKVNIKSYENRIVISNNGNALEFPLERYSEPYFLDGSKQKSSCGLGFGLYITWHVIRLHNMQLTYERQNSKNIFTIDFLHNPLQSNYYLE